MRPMRTAPNQGVEPPRAPSRTSSPSTAGRRWPVSMLALCLALGASATLSAPAQARSGDIGTRFKVNDDDPISSIPTEAQRNTDPMAFGGFLQDLIARAEGAFRAKAYATAVKYYEALARAVPQHALSFSRLCSSYAELGKLDIAAANCAKAVRLDGARVLDHFRLISLMLEEKKLSATDVGDIDASLAALRSHAADEEEKRKRSPQPAAAPPAPPPLGQKTLEQVKAEFEAERLESMSLGVPPKTAPAAKDLPLEIEVLACRVGVRLNDAKRLDQCVKALDDRHANLRLVLPFKWARAVVNQDQAAAMGLLGQARQLHFPDATLEAMQAEQQRTFAPSGVLGFFKRWALAGVIALIGVLGVGLVRRLRRASASVPARSSST